MFQLQKRIIRLLVNLWLKTKLKLITNSGCMFWAMMLLYVLSCDLEVKTLKFTSLTPDSVNT